MVIKNLPIPAGAWARVTALTRARVRGKGEGDVLSDGWGPLQGGKILGTCEIKRVL